MTGDGHSGQPFGCQSFSLQPPEPGCQLPIPEWPTPEFSMPVPVTRRCVPQPIIRSPHSAPLALPLRFPVSIVSLSLARHPPPGAATCHPKRCLPPLHFCTGPMQIFTFALIEVPRSVQPSLLASGPLILSRLRRAASLVHVSTCQLASSYASLWSTEPLSLRASTLPRFPYTRYSILHTLT